MIVERPPTDLSIEKIRDMLAAHYDGVYLFSARHNVAQIIEFLLGVISMRESDIATLKHYDRNDQKLINEMYEALTAIRAICGEDIAIHFSKKIANQVNKAIAHAEEKL